MRIKALVLTILLLLTGCGTKINTCNIKTPEIEQNWKYTSKKDNLQELELDIIYDNSIFSNIDTFDSLTQKEKEVLEKEILKKLGFNETKYKGFTIDVVIEKQIKVKVKANYQESDKELLKKIGIDIKNSNVNNIIKDMKANGANCK